MELVGFSKEVKMQFRDVLFPNVSPTTIGQVLLAFSVSAFQWRIKDDRSPIVFDRKRKEPTNSLAPRDPKCVGRRSNGTLRLGMARSF